MVTVRQSASIRKDLPHSPSPFLAFKNYNTIIQYRIWLQSVGLMPKAAVFVFPYKNKVISCRELYVTRMKFYILFKWPDYPRVQCRSTCKQIRFMVNPCSSIIQWGYLVAVPLRIGNVAINSATAHSRKCNVVQPAQPPNVPLFLELMVFGPGVRGSNPTYNMGTSAFYHR